MDDKFLNDISKATFRAMLRSNGLVQHQIKSYNWFINRIVTMVESLEPRIVETDKKTHQITIEKCVIGSPCVQLIDGTVKGIYFSFYKNKNIFDFL